MFRLDGLPPVDPLEEKKKIRKATQDSVLLFFFMCAAIRMGMQKV